MPPRDWHMELKEFVRQRMYTEMEPIRVEVASLHKKMQMLDQKTSTALALPDVRKDEALEKKLDVVSPQMEAMVEEMNGRVTKAEGVLRELGALHDKFAQRHDSLVQCLANLDKRVSQMDDTVAKTKALVDVSPVKAPMSNVAKLGEVDPRDRESPKNMNSAAKDMATTPRYARPGLGALGGEVAQTPMQPQTPMQGRVDSRGKNIWNAIDQKASLEVEEFSFNVSRRSGVPLGVVLRDDGFKLIVEKIEPGNSLPVNPGDRLVAIDGVRGDSKVLLEMIKRTGQLTISCQRLLSTSI